MPLLDSDVSVAKKIFDVNVFAVVAVTQAFAPLLIASKGTIINIGSVLGKMPFPWQGYYNASKAAVAIMTDQMRLEFSPWGVRAILVTTGAIKTKFFDNLPSAPHLPENSLYYPAKDVIEPALAGTEVEKNAKDVNSYAEIVVNNALRSSPKKHLWSGGGALITWLASTFGWSTVWVGNFPLVYELLVQFSLANLQPGYVAPICGSSAGHHKQDPRRREGCTGSAEGKIITVTPTRFFESSTRFVASFIVLSHYPSSFITLDSNYTLAYIVGRQKSYSCLNSLAYSYF